MQDVNSEILHLSVSEISETFTSPVVVGQFDVVSRRQDLAVLQPDEVRIRDTLGHAGEHGAAPCGSGDGLRPLHELRRSFRTEERRGWSASAEREEDTTVTETSTRLQKHIQKSHLEQQRCPENTKKMNLSASVSPG